MAWKYEIKIQRNGETIKAEVDEKGVLQMINPPEGFTLVGWLDSITQMQQCITHMDEKKLDLYQIKKIVQ